MATGQQQAKAAFWRMMSWIGLAAVVMVGGALTYLALSVGLTFHMVIATVAGVFLSTLLGCGLFALAFFSDKSGHDGNVSNSTTRQSNEDS